MANPTLTVTKDFTKEFEKIIASFKHDEVVVGIPAEDTNRENDERNNSGITNAALLAINNFGSTLQNIPARPVMEIGIRNAQEGIAEQFKKLAQAVLSEGVPAFEVYYNRAGIIASQSIKKAINDQEGIAPPAEATLANRKANGFLGQKALIVTGQMRNAITWVVKRKL